MPVKLIKDHDVFKKFLAGDNMVISFFYVPWCPKCRQLSPIIRKLSDIYIYAEFLKIDCMECPKLSQHYDVMCFPTVLFFEGGVRLNQFIGGDACMLLKKIQAHYGKLPLNLERFDKEDEGKKSRSFELERPGPEDAKLGNNPDFLSRMKASCASYTLTFKEWNEKKNPDRTVTSSKDFEPTAQEQHVEQKRVSINGTMNLEAAESVEPIIREKSIEKRRFSKKGISNDSIKTVPLLYRVANLSLAEEEKNKINSDSDEEKLPKINQDMRQQSSVFRFPESQFNLVSEEKEHPKKTKTVSSRTKFAQQNKPSRISKPKSILAVKSTQSTKNQIKMKATTSNKIKLISEGRRNTSPDSPKKSITPAKTKHPPENKKIK